MPATKTFHLAVAGRAVAAACGALLLTASLAFAQGNPADANGTNGASATAPTGGNASGAATGAMTMPHGVVPNRAELPGSAFQKLDAANKGYVTMEDVAQLQGFESAFRQADQNRDGRLNASEFNSAWGIWTGNTP